MAANFTIGGGLVAAFLFKRRLQGWQRFKS